MFKEGEREDEGQQKGNHWCWQVLDKTQIEFSCMLIEEPSMNIIFFPIANPAAHHEECDSERGERRDKGGNEALETTQASQTKARHLFQATKSGREVAIPDSLFHHSFLISISAPLTRRTPEAMSAALTTRTGLLNSCFTPRATTRSPQSVNTTFGRLTKITLDKQDKH